MRFRTEKIAGVLDHTGDSVITVFGDYCLDKYLYIDAARDEISLETGLTAYQVNRKGLYPGAAGTVTNNLRALGARVRCVGLIGDDGEGYELIKCLEKIGAGTAQMVRSSDISTNTYIKPMRGAAGAAYNEMNRIDIRNFTGISGELEEQLLHNLTEAVRDSSGIVIIEQFLERGSSAVTDRIRSELADMAGRFPDKFFYADSRGNIGLFRNIIVKCNEHELPNIAQSERGQDESVVMAGARTLLADNGRAVIVTLGAKGAYVFEDGCQTRIPAFSVEGPIDIVGAGDASSAGIILGLTLGLTLPEAALLGGCVSSITIQQLGVTGTATVGQVKCRLQELDE